MKTSRITFVEKPRMQPEDELCLCFHVTKRKVANYIRIEKPRRVGQLSDCYGAGTGCGWCRPFLRRMFEQAQADGTVEGDLPSKEEYAAMRAGYIKEGKGTPPAGASPEAGDASE